MGARAIGVARPKRRVKRVVSAGEIMAGIVGWRAGAGQRILSMAAVGGDGL